MLPERVTKALRRDALPLFVYDLAAVAQRVERAASLVDQYYYPVKACAVEAVISAAVGCGAGLDLCSAGDLAFARAADRRVPLSFTSPHVSDELLRKLVAAGAVFDADSEEQITRWRGSGGSACGVRLATADHESPYGIKFGIEASDLHVAAREKDAPSIDGLHVHEQHRARTAAQMTARLEELLARVDDAIISRCRYVNVGGGWPVTDGEPAADDELRHAFSAFRKSLAGRGFRGVVAGEPGEWVVGPAGYWAAVVSAVKRHPLDSDRHILVLDTATPVPCRPSTAPFALLRGDCVVEGVDSVWCDLYGSANTGADTIGLGVALPLPRRGDVVVSCGQGAYVRSLTGSFNERALPGLVMV